MIYYLIWWYCSSTACIMHTNTVGDCSIDRPVYSVCIGAKQR